MKPISLGWPGRGAGRPGSRLNTASTSSQASTVRAVETNHYFQAYDTAPDPPRRPFRNQLIFAAPVQSSKPGLGRAALTCGTLSTCGDIIAQMLTRRYNRVRQHAEQQTSSAVAVATHLAWSSNDL